MADKNHLKRDAEHNVQINQIESTFMFFFESWLKVLLSPSLSHLFDSEQFSRELG